MLRIVYNKFFFCNKRDGHLAHGKCLWNIVLICWSHTQTRTLYTFEISRRLTIFKSIIWTLLNHILTMFESLSLASIVMSNNVIHSAKSRLLKTDDSGIPKDIHLCKCIICESTYDIIRRVAKYIGVGVGGVKDKRILTYMYKNIYHMLSSICGRYHPCYKKNLSWFARPEDRKHTR